MHSSQINFRSYRVEDIEDNIHKMGVYPLDIMLTGVTGAGKSTTINTFLKTNAAKVGKGVDPETMDLDSYELSEIFRVWDTPGLGDGVAIDTLHKKQIMDLLYKTYSMHDQTYAFIDMAVVIVEGANRDMGTTYSLLNEVIVPNIQSDRIFVLINQADVAMKGRHWNYDINEPDAKLYNFLESQALSIQKRVHEATGMQIKKPVYYSAEYSWNVDKVLDFIIDNMPIQRRLLVK